MTRTVVGDRNGIQFSLDVPPSMERKLKDGKFAIQPARDFLRRSGFIIQAGAAERAPADTGRLRGSIHSDPQRGGDLVVIGSNVKYAAAQEFGTRPFWPPWSSPSFQRWARRKGLNAFLVARSIARRGIRPKKFLRGSWDAYRRGPMQREMSRFKIEVERAWGRR